MCICVDLQDYDQIKDEQKSGKLKLAEKLSGKIGQRMKPEEAIARNVIDEHALDKVKFVFILLFDLFPIH